MSLLLECQCGQRLKVADRYQGKRVKCPSCSHPIAVPEMEGVSATPLPRKPSRKVADPTRSRQESHGDNKDPKSLQEIPSRTPVMSARWNVIFTLGWIPIGWTFAYSAPRFALGPRIVEILGNSLPLLVTCALIGWNLWVSLSILNRTGRIRSSLPLAALQLPLFSLLFLQIASHLGAEYYQWSHTPGSLDWIWLAIVHAFRAADLVDVLQGYGWTFQMVHSGSLLTACVIMLFHLVIDLFMLRVLFEWFHRLRIRLLGSDSDLRLAEQISGSVVIGFLGIWLVTAWLSGWQWKDYFLWPLDNLLRVVDFVDAMQILHWQLHSVPSGLWVGTLTLILRLLILLAIGETLAHVSRSFRVLWLGGIGLSGKDLKEISHNATNPTVRAKAAEQLVVLRNARKGDASIGWNSGKEIGMALGVGILVSGLLMLIIGVRFPTAALVTQALGEEDRSARQALGAIRRAGPRANSSIPELVESLERFSPERQAEIVEVLGYLGPAAADELIILMTGENALLRERAVVALKQIGPPCVPQLTEAWLRSASADQEQLEELILSFGDQAIPGVIEVLNPGNMVMTIVLLDQLSPYWTQLSSGNPTFDLMVEHQDAIRLLQDPKATYEEKTKSLSALLEASTVSDAPFLIGLLGMNDTATVQAVKKALESMIQSDPDVFREVITAFESTSNEALLNHLLSLNWGKHSRYIEDGVEYDRIALVLVKWVNHPDPQIRQRMISKLRVHLYGHSVRENKDPVTFLIERLFDPDPVIRDVASRALTEKSSAPGPKRLPGAGQGFQEPLKHLLILLKSGSAEEQAAAFQILSSLMEHYNTPRLAEERLTLVLKLLLIDLLGDPDPEFCRKCSELLVHFHPGGLDSASWFTTSDPEEVRRKLTYLRETPGPWLNTVYREAVIALQSLRKQEQSPNFSEMSEFFEDVRSWEWIYLQGERGVKPLSGPRNTPEMRINRQSFHLTYQVRVAFNALNQVVLLTVPQAPHAIEKTVVEFFDPETGKLARGFAVGSLVGPHFALSRNGTRLAFIYPGAAMQFTHLLRTESQITRTLPMVSVWDLTTGEEIVSYPLISKEEYQQILTENAQTSTNSVSIADIELSPDGKKLAVAMTGNRLVIFEAESGKVQSRISIPDDYGQVLEFSPDGNSVAGFYLNNLGVWNTETGKLVTQVPRGTTSFPGQLFATEPESGELLIVPGGTKLAAYRLSDPQHPRWTVDAQRENLFDHDSPIIVVAQTPDHRRLLTFEKKGMKLLDTETGQSMLLLNMGRLGSTAAFSPDGNYLAITRENGMLEVLGP